MGDQAERVVLEAEDMVTPVVAQANAGLDSFEKKAESSHGKVVRITDQTRTSVQRLITSLEKQAETYGKSGVDRLITQRDQLLQRYAKEPQAIDAIMGIELHNTAGELKPTSQILTEISEALAKLPEGLQRDAAAMDLFKRVGIEAIPFMTELNENLRVAHEEGFGPTEEDVRRFQEYQQEVTVLETKWDALVRKFKEGLVITVSWVGKGVDWFLNNVGTAGDAERQHREEDQARQDAADIASLGGVTQMSRTAHRREMADMETRAPGIMQNRDATEQQIAGLRAQQQGLVGNFGWVQMLAPTEEEQGRMKKAADMQKQIEQLQGMLDAATRATRRTDLRGGKEEEDRLRAHFFGTPAGMQKAYEDAKKDVEKYQKQLFEPESPLTKQEVTDLSGKLRTAQGTESRLKASLDSQKSFIEAQKEFQRDARSFEAKGEEAELDAVGKIYRQRDLLLQQAKAVKASEADIAAIRKSADEQAGKELEKEQAANDKKWKQLLEESEKISGAVFRDDIAEGTKKLEEQAKAVGKLAAEWVKLRDTGQSQAVAHQKKMIGLTGDSDDPMAILRDQQAVELTQIQQRRQTALSSLSSNPLEAIEQRAVAEKQAANEVGELRYQWEEKLAEVRKQAEEEEKKLIEKQEKSIEKVTDKLFDTLITKPKEFGKDLAKTIREELMKPITEGMSHMSANILQPAIYGEDGTGGLAGIFKGIFGGGKGSDPVKVSTDQNTVATVQNSAHVAALGAYARRRIRGEVLDGLRRDDHISRHARAKARAEGADADAGPVPLVYPDALVGDVLAPDEYAVEKECEELIQEALGFLPARERLVMLAYYFSGKFMREIGADLDVPMAAPENPVALPARKLGRA